MNSDDLQPETIGPALLAFRGAKGLTLQDVSQSTGISVPTLSKIENCKVTPSVRSFVSLLQFLGSASASGTSSTARRAITRDGEAIRYETTNHIFDIHAADLLDKAMHPIVAEIVQHDVPPIDDWISHEGDEFIYVLAGRVTVYLADYRPYSLGKGESTYFDSGMKHIVISESDDHAQVLAISTSSANSLRLGPEKSAPRRR
ncbi:helix-turn-helix domain-containing protein [Pseudooceanicola pacificus]|jgi:transcriptional regulator with XRE-family HTH domain|nr:XRE family transcriptional regulator [Pseudooceanicola pacificus]